MTKSEVVGLSGSGYGFTVKENPLINTMTHGTHHPVDVRDILIALAIWKEGTQIVSVLLEIL